VPYSELFSSNILNEIQTLCNQENDIMKSTLNGTDLVNSVTQICNTLEQDIVNSIRELKQRMIQQVSLQDKKLWSRYKNEIQEARNLLMKKTVDNLAKSDEFKSYLNKFVEVNTALITLKEHPAFLETMITNEFEQSKVALDYLSRTAQKIKKDIDITNLDLYSALQDIQKNLDSQLLDRSQSDIKKRVNTLEDLRRTLNEKVDNLTIVTWCYDNEPDNDRAAKEIANVLKHVETLMSLTIEVKAGKKRITDTGLKEMSNAISLFKDLTSLTMILSNNQNSNEGVIYLANAIKKLTKLDYLYLDFRGGRNSITDEGFKYVFEALSHLASLNTLTIYFSGFGNHNRVTDQGITDFSNSLSIMQSISDLLLSFSEGDNFITDDGLDQLAQALSHLKQLNSFVLYLSGGFNAISDDGIAHLSKKLQTLPQLDSLTLDFSGGKHIITDIGIHYLSEKLAKITNFRSLALHFSGFGNHNHVTDESIEYLASSITKMKQLQTLSLGFSGGENNITDDGIQILMNSVQGLEFLSELTLNFYSGKNKVTEQGKKAIDKAASNKKLSKCSISV
jgi:hypothetical protein